MGTTYTLIDNSQQRLVVHESSENFEFELEHTSADPRLSPLDLVRVSMQLLKTASYFAADTELRDLVDTVVKEESDGDYIEFCIRMISV